jgi:stress response protein SCP2
MKRPGLAAALLALACCAHAEFFGDNRSRQHEDYEKYLACIKDYASASALRDATPSDVAAAAISACDTQYQSLMTSTYQLFGMAQQAGDVLSETRQKARDYAIRIVIEARGGR